MSILKVDLDPNENPTPQVAAFLLDTAWKISKEFGICPICLVELMHDMTMDAYDEGKISHLQSDPDDMGEPLTETRQ